MKFLQIITFLAIITFALVQAGPKLEMTVLKHVAHCDKRVTPKSTVQLEMVRREMATDKLFGYRKIQMKPGERTAVQELGLEKELLGMCVGEIRRIIVPSELELADKPTAIEIEVLDIENPPFFTPFFWAVLTGIGVTYVAVSMLAKKQDRAKNQTIKKAE